MFQQALRPNYRVRAPVTLELARSSHIQAVVPTANQIEQGNLIVYSQMISETTSRVMLKSKLEKV